MNDNFIKHINSNKEMEDNLYIKYYHKTRKGKEKIFIKKPYRNFKGDLLVNSNLLNDVYIIDSSTNIYRLIDSGEILDKQGEIHIIDRSKSLYAKCCDELA